MYFSTRRQSKRSSKLNVLFILSRVISLNLNVNDANPKKNTPIEIFFQKIATSFCNNLDILGFGNETQWPNNLGTLSSMEILLLFA